VIAEPPLLAGVVHETTASLSLVIAPTAVGADGTPICKTAADGTDDPEKPLRLFFATTVNV
jgi:hypothetical protein